MGGLKAPQTLVWAQEDREREARSISGLCPSRLSPGRTVTYQWLNIYQVVALQARDRKRRFLGVSPFKEIPLVQRRATSLTCKPQKRAEHHNINISDILLDGMGSKGLKFICKYI